MTPKTLYEAAKKALEGNVLYDAARRIRVERRQARQAEERRHDIEGIVGYMLNPEFFNRRPGHEYVEACAALSGIDIRQNELVLEDERLLEHELGRRALALGYTRNDLLAVTHQFAAVRNGSA